MNHKIAISLQALLILGICIFWLFSLNFDSLAIGGAPSEADEGVDSDASAPSLDTSMAISVATSSSISTASSPSSSTPLADSSKTSGSTSPTASEPNQQDGQVNNDNSNSVDEAVGINSALTSCLSKSHVQYLTHNVSSFAAGSNNSNTTWASLIEPLNLRLQYLPAVVAIAENIDHIQSAVRCGVKHNLRISAKSGGHSFGSYGLGGEDGHLVIDLGRMQDVTLHEDKETATIQPGARLGHVATQLYQQGNRAISHGSCPGVGIAGQTLHGGFGLSSRNRGLSLDWLKSATVILANSSAVKCSKTQNADLFWAIRGAGSSFGIVGEFEFNTFEADNEVTTFSITQSWNEEKAIGGFKMLQEMAITAPSELDLILHLNLEEQVIMGVYHGGRTACEHALKPILDQTDTRINHIKTLNWLQALQEFTFGHVLDQTYPSADHPTFYVTNVMTKTLSDAQIRSLSSALFNNHTTSTRQWGMFLELHGGPYSQVSQVLPQETSYGNRDKLLLFQFSSFEPNSLSGEYPQQAISLLTSFRRSITDGLKDEKDWGMYPNYLDTELDNPTATNLYWGENLPRLREVKKVYDPNDVFWNPQGVRAP